MSEDALRMSNIILTAKYAQNDVVHLSLSTGTVWVQARVAYGQISTFVSLAPAKKRALELKRSGAKICFGVEYNCFYIECDY
jgi:hypothetical protein